MKKVNDLHNKAMEYAELAFISKLNGNIEKYFALNKEAFYLEAKAAMLLRHEYNLEPTRSILMRSAATIAMDCDLLSDAERFIAMGLSGNPPYEIADELRDLFESVNFNRHLRLLGVKLDEQEFQMSLSGKVVGMGIALSDAFIKRVSDTQRLIFRTVERLSGKPYREGGTASKGILDYSLFVTAPRSGCFAVTLRVSGPSQPALPGTEEITGYIHPSKVIDELFTCFELFDNSQEEKLKKIIPEPAYYRNFVGLARNISPDGADVKLVGFTSVRLDQERQVRLCKTPDQIRITSSGKVEHDGEMLEKSEEIVIRGKLLFADARNSQQNKIQVVDDDGKSHDIKVPEGMMSDIVKPLWEERVEIKSSVLGKTAILDDIRPI